MSNGEISHVSDTALWVAYFRGVETARADRLFVDPLAVQLAGEKGQRIAKMVKGAQYVGWSVAIRTWIIDSYIQNLINKGVDTVLNLGAGLDTRPYRLELPKTLLWVEVDFANIIELKASRLGSEKPRCKLERVKMDLSDREARNRFFSELNTRAGKVLVLTEGVVPYLSNEQVAGLADDLRMCDKFQFWILDYFSVKFLHKVRRYKMMRQLKNAPFRFSPKNWFGFFEQHQWTKKEIRYLGEESEKLGRKIPMPVLFSLLLKLAPVQGRQFVYKLSGYVLLEPKKA